MSTGISIVDPTTLPRVRCEIRPHPHGYSVLVEVRSVTEPNRASQTIINPGSFLSARDLEHEVQRQAARLAGHIHDTVPDAAIDPDACARLAVFALRAAALKFHNAEMSRAS